MRAALLVAFLLSPLLLTPSSAAAGGACAGGHVAVDASAALGRTFYVGTDGSVWEEANGIKGLQCHGLVIGGRFFPLDARVVV